MDLTPRKLKATWTMETEQDLLDTLAHLQNSPGYIVFMENLIQELNSIHYTPIDWATEGF